MKYIFYIIYNINLTRILSNCLLLISIPNYDDLQHSQFDRIPLKLTPKDINNTTAPPYRRSSILPIIISTHNIQIKLTTRDRNHRVRWSSWEAKWRPLIDNGPNLKRWTAGAHTEKSHNFSPQTNPEGLLRGGKEFVRLGFLLSCLLGEGLKLFWYFFFARRRQYHHSGQF